MSFSKEPEFSHGKAPANGASTGVALSNDGRFAVFQSAASNLVANDKRAWIDTLQQNLGATACGQVACNAGLCTITVQWDDSRGSSGSTTQSFSTTTRI